MADLRSLIKQHYENIREGNTEGDRAIFSPDVVTVAPGAGTLEGIEAFLAFERAFHDAFPDGQMELKSSVESGNTIATEGVFMGTHTGPLAGPGGEVSPTNRRIELPFADVFEVEGGCVTQHHIYFDQMALLAQLGLMPSPDAAQSA